MSIPGRTKRSMYRRSLGWLGTWRPGRPPGEPPPPPSTNALCVAAPNAPVLAFVSPVKWHSPKGKCVRGSIELVASGKTDVQGCS